MQNINGKIIVRVPSDKYKNVKSNMDNDFISTRPVNMNGGFEPRNSNNQFEKDADLKLISQDINHRLGCINY